MSRVKPPKTTMPKTLAADPRSQYATDLELVWGQDEDSGDRGLEDSPMLRLRAPNGDVVEADELWCLNCTGPCDRKALRNGVCRVDRYADGALDCCWRHLRQTKASGKTFLEARRALMGDIPTVAIEGNEQRWQMDTGWKGKRN